MSIELEMPDGSTMSFIQGEPVVLLGANGSGKTRFGVKVEELNDRRFGPSSVREGELLVHRISAQKSLDINESLSIQEIDISNKELFLGSATTGAQKQGYRYGGYPNTHLLNDYDKVLSLFFSLENKQLQEAHIRDINAVNNGEEREPPNTTVVDKATKIWNELLPHRKIDLTGNGVHVIYEGNRYRGRELSDGERVILYMICQVLVLPSSSFLIIDEPELHIHKAVVNKLWDILEDCRLDCVFMYITHDIDFAVARNANQMIWLKGFDGTNWDYEFINTNDYSLLPEGLLLELLGTRQKVLFVEGEKGSYDSVLYKELYQNKGYHIIPCGGCNDVVRIYKAKRVYEKLNSVEAHCIIDRDFRTDEEIVTLQADGVAFLEVAEVENLFVVPALLDIMQEQLGCPYGAAQQAKDFIINLYNRTKAKQIGEAFIREVNHQLTIFNIDDIRALPAEIQSTIVNKFSEVNIQSYFDEKQRLFNAVNSLDNILKVYNFKELSKKIGPTFGLQGNTYPERVLNLLKTNPNGVRGQIVDALKPYIPDLP